MPSNDNVISHIRYARSLRNASNHTLLRCVHVVFHAEKSGNSMYKHSII